MRMLASIARLRELHLEESSDLCEFALFFLSLGHRMLFFGLGPEPGPRKYPKYWPQTQVFGALRSVSRGFGGKSYEAPLVKLAYTAIY